ncbi:HEAT domain containing protein [Rippkaea orientalis PCC 8801]|uniref:HEAT domain containing protein n=1 Tax=Rippkaea orientalis (strain PCC 8801 / RF-1) TaxID=41431 RepID=B7JYG6_RIPO1|nr:HEAT repeat domain-containing protein [Rippkaea orientalis]ACK64836.1 HEAT domain containing protein [Rippkaea orientalis PCC 8801]
MLQKRSLLTAISSLLLVMVSGSLPVASQPIVLQKEAKLAQSASDNLIPALLDENSETRENAFKKLRELGDSVAVPALIEALQDKDWQVQAVAAYTLGRFGSEAKSAIPALSKAIKAENADVRFVAAKALGEIGSEAVVPALIEALQDKDENVRVNAAESLKKIAPEAKAAVPALTNALWDGNWYVRSRAAATIAKLGLDAVDLPSLVEPWRSNNPPDSGAIVSLMVAIQPSILNELDEIPLFFIKSLQNENPNVRQSAAIALGQFSRTSLGHLQENEAVNVLIKSLQDGNATVRESAAEALGNGLSYDGSWSYENSPTLARTIVFALIEALKDGNAEVRQAVTNSLKVYGDIPSKDASVIVPALVEALKDENAGVRQSGAKALGLLDKEKLDISATNAIVSAFIKALQDEDEGVRQSAMEALRGWDNNEVVLLVAALLKIVQQEDANVEVRRSAAASISRAYEIKDVATLQALTQAFQDEDLGIRQNIAIALWKNKQLDTTNTLNILNEGLLSKDPFIQFDAIVGLATMGEKAKPVLPSLIPLLQENIEPLRYIAALLIVNIAPRKEYVPILLEILSKETAQNDIESEHTIDALERIHSKEALSVYIESWKFEDKRERYIIHDISHECIYNFLDVPELYPLLIQSLKNENIRFSVINSILKYSFFKEEKQLINSKLINIVIPRLITILENKYEGNPALKEIFVFKDRDIRRSAAYALGEIANSSADEESVIIKDTKNKQKIINALMAVVQNQKDDLDVRWMTATSLQKIGINQDSFFTKYALVNPKTIRLQNKSPTPSFRFDRYSSNYYYSVEYGCGNGLGEIYSELRRRLSRRNSSN